MCINVVYSWIEKEENIYAALLLTKKYKSFGYCSFLNVSLLYIINDYIF